MGTCQVALGKPMVMCAVTHDCSVRFSRAEVSVRYWAAMQKSPRRHCARDVRANTCLCFSFLPCMLEGLVGLHHKDNSTQVGSEN